jgi:hypothetical protein
VRMLVRVAYIYEILKVDERVQMPKLINREAVSMMLGIVPTRLMFYHTRAVLGQTHMSDIRDELGWRRQRECAACGNDTSRLLPCARCRCRMICGEECNARDWKLGDRDHCGHIGEACREYEVRDFGVPKDRHSISCKIIGPGTAAISSAVFALKDLSSGFAVLLKIDAPDGVPQGAHPMPANAVGSTKSNDYANCEWVPVKSHYVLKTTRSVGSGERLTVMDDAMY